jgi:hypothetical protein
VIVASLPFSAYVSTPSVAYSSAKAAENPPIARTMTADKTAIESNRFRIRTFAVFIFNPFRRFADVYCPAAISFRHAPFCHS